MTVENGGRKLRRDERSLWDEITRSVRPLRPRIAAAPAPTAIDGRPQKATTSPRTAAQRPQQRAPMPEPLQRRERQRLVQGHKAIDARLDLHGKTQAQAHELLLRFLHRAQAAGATFVLVITGKGVDENAVGRGVLRRQVPLWLKLPEFAVYVSAFEQAHVSHGGEGALYIRLRRPRRRQTGE